MYRKSGKGFECAICGYDKHVEIAHIKAVSDFDDSALISEINSKIILLLYVQTIIGNMIMDY